MLKFEENYGERESHKLAYILLALLVCMPIALAEKDCVTTGPYNISFDIGFPKSSYQIGIIAPVENESLDGNIKSTKYEMNITPINITFAQYESGIEKDLKLLMHKFVSEGIELIPRSAVIEIVEYEMPYEELFAPEELKQQLYQMFTSQHANNTQSEVREIDGMKGAIASAYYRGVLTYQARWLPLGKQLTVVYLSSTYPWEEGTLALLKTIHIEHINKPENKRI
jgi:hypothetical protein